MRCQRSWKLSDSFRLIIGVNAKYQRTAYFADLQGRITPDLFTHKRGANDLNVGLSLELEPQISSRCMQAWAVPSGATATRSTTAVVCAGALVEHLKQRSLRLRLYPQPRRSPQRRQHLRNSPTSAGFGEARVQGTIDTERCVPCSP